MNGEWIYEEKLDRWHLIWSRNQTPNEAIGQVSETVAWCGFRRPSEGEVTKSGDRIDGFADSVHDECYRKSEEM